jgi:hypothetical protein
LSTDLITGLFEAALQSDAAMQTLISCLEHGTASPSIEILSELTPLQVMCARWSLVNLGLPIVFSVLCRSQPKAHTTQIQKRSRWANTRHSLSLSSPTPPVRFCSLRACASFHSSVERIATNRGALVSQQVLPGIARVLLASKPHPHGRSDVHMAACAVISALSQRGSFLLLDTAILSDVADALYVAEARDWMADRADVLQTLACAATFRIVSATPSVLQPSPETVPSSVRVGGSAHASVALRRLASDPLCATRLLQCVACWQPLCGAMPSEQAFVDEERCWAIGALATSSGSTRALVQSVF